MVRHVILWKLKNTDEDKERVKLGIKEGLEALNGKIPGLREIHVHTEGLPGSSADVMLDSVFDDMQALENYRIHPAHVAVADSRVRPYAEIRLCLNYEE